MKDIPKIKLSPEEKYRLIFMGTTGFIGGIGKITYETVFLSESYHNSQVNSLIIVPGYGLLGAVSALLVLSELAKFVPLSKIIKFGLIAGFLFPSVISANLKIADLKQNLTQTETQAVVELEKIANLTQDKQVQLSAIQSIREVGNKSQNGMVREDAVKSVVEVSRNSNDAEVELSVVESLTEVAQETKDTNLQEDAVSSLTKVSTKSKNSEVRATTVQNLRSLLESNPNPEVRQSIENAIANIEQVSN